MENGADPGSIPGGSIYFYFDDDKTPIICEKNAVICVQITLKTPLTYEKYLLGKSSGDIERKWQTKQHHTFVRVKENF